VLKPRAMAPIPKLSMSLLLASLASLSVLVHGQPLACQDEAYQISISAGAALYQISMDLDSERLRAKLREIRHLSWDYSNVLQLPNLNSERIGSGNRSYHVLLPQVAATKPHAGWPAVIMYHGYSSDAKALAWQTKHFRKEAAERGYILAYLDGTAQPEAGAESGYRYWNTGSAAGFMHEPGAHHDDVTFTASVIEELVEKFGVNPKQVFVAGISNGGSMVLRAACERPDLFAAAVSVHGSLEMREGDSCGTKCDASGDCNWDTKASGCQAEDWVQKLPPVFDCTGLLKSKMPLMIVSGLTAFGSSNINKVDRTGYVHRSQGRQDPSYTYPPLNYMWDHFKQGFGCEGEYQSFSNGTHSDWSSCNKFKSCNLAVCLSSAGDWWYQENYDVPASCRYTSQPGTKCTVANEVSWYGDTTATMQLSDHVLEFFDVSRGLPQ